MASAERLVGVRFRRSQDLSAFGIRGLTRRVVDGSAAVHGAGKNP